MTKRTIAVVLLFVMVGGMLAACKSEITQEEAVNIALKDLGVNAADVTVHVHEGTYSNQPCFKIYISSADANKTYLVSTYGDILGVMDGAGHSH